MSTFSVRSNSAQDPPRAPAGLSRSSLYAGQSSDDHYSTAPRVYGWSPGVTGSASHQPQIPAARSSCSIEGRYPESGYLYEPAQPATSFWAGSSHTSPHTPIAPSDIRLQVAHNSPFQSARSRRATLAHIPANPALTMAIQPVLVHPEDHIPPPHLGHPSLNNEAYLDLPAATPPRPSRSLADDIAANSASLPAYQPSSIAGPGGRYDGNDLPPSAYGAPSFSGSASHPQSTDPGLPFSRSQPVIPSAYDTQTPTPPPPASYSEPESLYSADYEPLPPRAALDVTPPMHLPSVEGSALSSSRGTGRKPKKMHGCWMCHKSFDRPSTLRKHLLVHTGEKCELIFPNPSSRSRTELDFSIPVRDMQSQVRRAVQSHSPYETMPGTQRHTAFRSGCLGHKHAFGQRCASR
jgi:hypothetical protein